MWNDDMMLDGDFADFPTDPWVYFHPKIEGTLVPGAHATILMILGDQQIDADFEPTGRIDQTISLKAPAYLLHTVGGLHFSLSLSIDAEADPGESAVGDFSNTLSLGPVLIGDENGNPIPGTEHLLTLAGSSGLTYGLASVPEPNLAGCVLVLFPASLLGRRLRRKIV